MRRIVVASVILGMFILIASCGMNVLTGSGNKTSKDIDVSNFDMVDVSISSEINISVGEGTGYEVTVKGYENIVEHVDVHVTSNTLYVDYDLDDTWTVNDGDLTVNISLPKLAALSMSGAPDATISGIIEGDVFRLDVSGASSIEIEDIDVDKFSADLSGASDLTVHQGAVRKADFKISGAGNIKAFGMQTETARTSISGAGNSELNVISRLDAVISGAGSVEYKGDPVVSKHVSGVGSVSKYEE